jgi:hypothetical protein
MERILHVKENFPHFQERVLRRLFYEHFSLGYLTSLYLLWVHRDYVDQFLNDKKTYLPRLTVLSVNYNDLRNVTRNFTNDRTRLNCMKVKQLNACPKTTAHSEHFHAYFPLL